ncbi:MAG: FecR domain-containing protein [Patescibacteria group bacterium]
MAPGAEIAYVNRVDGEVSLNAASDTGGSKAFAVGDSVRVGDTVTTGEDSSAEIVFADASVVRLAANSSISISKSDGSNTELSLGS